MSDRGIIEVDGAPPATVANVVMMTTLSADRPINIGLGALARLMRAAIAFEPSYPRILVYYVVEGRRVCIMIFRTQETPSMRSTSEGRRILAANGAFVLGRAVIAGARTRAQVAVCVDRLAETLSSILGTPVGAQPAQMCNIVADFDTCMPIDLAQLSGWVRNSVLTDEFPGLHLCVKRTSDGAKVASCNVFATGRVVVLGQKDEASTADAVRIIMTVLRSAQRARGVGGHLRGYDVEVSTRTLNTVDESEMAQSVASALYAPAPDDAPSA